MIASGTVAALARAFTRYLSEIIPLSAAGETIVSVVMIGVVTAVNVWGTRKSSDLQNWTTLVKVLLMVLLSGLLLSLGHHGIEMPAAMGSTQQGSALVSSFGLAMIAVLWAYEGWQFGTYSAGEVLHPQKSFPRAFLLGSLILVFLYVVANVAYLVALGPTAATASDAIAATAATAVLGLWARKIVALTILISTFSSANCVVLTAPRVFYAMANDNLFFKKLAEVHPSFRLPPPRSSLWVSGRRAGVRGKIRRTDRRRHLHRLDFLRTRRRGDFPHTPGLKRQGDSLSGPGLSVYTIAIRPGRYRDRRQRHLSRLP